MTSQQTNIVYVNWSFSDAKTKRFFLFFLLWKRPTIQEKQILFFICDLKSKGVTEFVFQNVKESSTSEMLDDCRSRYTTKTGNIANGLFGPLPKTVSLSYLVLQKVDHPPHPFSFWFVVSLYLAACSAFFSAWPGLSVTSHLCQLPFRFLPLWIFP